MEKFDVIVIGMGPSSIFLAYELIKKSKNKKVLLIDQGKRVENRKCPIESLGKCVKCKPFCNITSGFSGAGAFSDGKLSLYNPNDDDIYVGGNLHNYIGVEETKKLIDYTDKIYLDFGADKHLEGIQYKEEISQISEKARKENIKLIDIPIRHLGTEKAHEIYKRLEEYLEEHNILMKFETIVDDLIIENNEIKGVSTISAKNENNKELFYSDKVVIAVGRKGANWLSNICIKYGIKTKSGIVDIGVRYELEDKVMKNINKYLYEGKFIGYPAPFKDKVRTFCMNPNGIVVNENTNGIVTVNGHSYEGAEKQTENTNFALLVAKHFSEPFKDSNGYGESIARLSNMLGGGVIVQRFGDLMRGRRSTEKRIEEGLVKPTLAATPGDLSLVLPKRILDGIIEMIYALDKIAPGTANDDTLLYGVEVKFYNMEVEIDNNLETRYKGLYIIGDGSGVTHSLSHASASGVYVARKIIEEM